MPLAIDVTDATFQAEVLERSAQVPVVVDLWAAWCAPCRMIGPILEKVVAERNGTVALVKVDVDANPQVAATFQVQSIPAVYALKDGQVVSGFLGAQPEPAVRAWLDQVAPAPTAADDLVATGDEASLRRAVELEPGNEKAVLALASLLVDKGGDDEKKEALGLLARLPETAEVRHLLALARVGAELDPTKRLDALLDRVKQDAAARQEYLDLLEVMGPDDPRVASYRKALTARLF